MDVSFTWSKDNKPIDTTSKTFVVKNDAKGSTLQITKASKDLAGWYICSAKSASGETAEVSVEVSVKGGGTEFFTILKIKKLFESAMIIYWN